MSEDIVFKKRKSSNIRKKENIGIDESNLATQLDSQAIHLEDEDKTDVKKRNRGKNRGISANIVPNLQNAGFSSTSGLYTEDIMHQLKKQSTFDSTNSDQKAQDTSINLTEEEPAIPVEMEED